VEPADSPVSHAGFWDSLYAAGQDGWDLGEASPALVDWLDAGGRFEAGGGQPSRSSELFICGGPEMAPALPQPRTTVSCQPRTTVSCQPRTTVSSQPQTTVSPLPRTTVSSQPRTTVSPRVAVPGAGRAHDARLLARRGYRVTAFDFSEAAVAEARRLAAAEAVEVAIEARDVFTLPRDHAGAFDGVWEYTCFCAIDPARRDEYASVLHAILRPGGVLLACFFPLRDGTDGPPFPVSRDQIERALAGRFTVLEAGPPPRSVERRRGLEWLVRARREH
jgi:methyl halide transferase